MSLLQNEQLEKIEKQGRDSQIYKFEFFLTVLVCIGLTAYVLSLYVPEGFSSIPITLEATVFAIILAMLSSPWSGRLMAIVFAAACAVFAAVKINAFGDPKITYYASSFYLWIIGVSVFLLALIAWKLIGLTNSDNKEAREYEKHMRKIGRW